MPRGLSGRSHLGRLTVLAVTALSAVTACSAPGSPAGGGSSVAPGAASPPPERPVSGLAKGMVLPIEGYLISYPERIAWQRAQQNLWKSCMERFGFKEFDPPPPGIVPDPNFNDANMARRYGISNAEEAEQYGYHLPGGNVEPPAWEPAAGAEGAVFAGVGTDLRSGSYQGEKVPEGGCRGEAQRKLGELRYTLAGKVDYASLEESRKDPAVRKAVAAWSSCMKKQGYAVDHPYETPDLVTSLGAPAPSADEIALATADIGCKKKTDLIGIWYAAEKRIQLRRIEENQLALDEERKKNDAVLKTAARVNG
ncbi:hypothetical protein SUDANB176_03477 [Streptomyces sp. enrichment culture]|uniref:hypothetical protein n=1 Tax=Streptomyces sp. enrichment culture TaxID=1795815 RepID=UPI003F57BA05